MRVLFHGKRQIFLDPNLKVRITWHVLSLDFFKNVFKSVPYTHILYKCCCYTLRLCTIEEYPWKYLLLLTTSAFNELLFTVILPPTYHPSPPLQNRSHRPLLLVITTSYHTTVYSDQLSIQALKQRTHGLPRWSGLQHDSSPSQSGMRIEREAEGEEIAYCQ